MITREQVLRKWFAEWTRLPAWGRSLAGVTLEISNQHHPERLGTCWTERQHITIYRSNRDGHNMAVELDTLIHEMAHAATCAAHDVRWQTCYSRAIREVTKIAIPRAAANYLSIQKAGEAAVKSWWVSSGNDFLWKVARAG